MMKTAEMPGYLQAAPALADFWEMPPGRRSQLLLEAVAAAHAWHYPRNRAYQRTVAARRVGPHLEAPEWAAQAAAQPARAQLDEMARLLRPTAQTFKSYIEMLGTPFPQDEPLPFLEWLADQLSLELPRERFSQFSRRYSFLEYLLADIERIYQDFGFEVSTSSGTSGRSTILLRDRYGIDRTVESFYLSFQRYLGMRADHRAIFIMPGHTRIAMARMAHFCVGRIGLPAKRVHFTIPFPAYPDQVRVRAGRTFRPGARGWFEHRFEHCFMNWANDHLVSPGTIRTTIRLLERAEASGDKVLLFGGWVHLHMVATRLLVRKRVITLPPGSVLGTGGGFKERYPFSPPHIRYDLHQVIKLEGGESIPFLDVYGMAEGNWAAMQCRQGSYHIPPWVYAVTLDDNGQIQASSDATGLLAFFDPFGGGTLFPPFFKTSDQVRLVNGGSSYDPARNCPCGEAGAYLTQGSIQRVDLLDEAGCAAQL